MRTPFTWFRGAGADPGGVGAVFVKGLREPLGQTGLVESPGERGHVLPPVTPHRDRPVGTVEIAPEVLVALHLSEVRQHVGEGPLIVAQSRPAVVILGYSPQKHLAVYRAGAAHHLPSRNGYFGSLPLGDVAQVLPAVRPEGGPQEIVSPFQVIGQEVQIRVVRACLQQQHGTVWVLGKPGGQHAA